MAKVCKKNGCNNEVRWTFKRFFGVIAFIVLGLILGPTGIGLVPWGGLLIIFFMNWNKCENHGFKM